MSNGDNYYISFLSSVQELGRVILSVACLAFQALSWKPFAEFFSRFTKLFLRDCIMCLSEVMTFDLFFCVSLALRAEILYRLRSFFLFFVIFDLENDFWVTLTLNRKNSVPAVS